MALRLDRLDGRDGFRIVGSDTYGYSASAAGDINGDGVDDLVVASSYRAFVVFGAAGSLPSRLELAELDGGDGFRLSQTPYSSYAYYNPIRFLARAGDINGDGLDDLVLGAPASYLNPLGPDESFVIFGSASNFPANIDLQALDGTNGFHLWGTDPRPPVGDVNGDGLDDLILGHPFAGSYSVGGVSVVLGSTGGFPAHVGFPGSQGPFIEGVDVYDTAGWSVGVADLNGDGIDDIVIGAPGQAYLFFPYIADSAVYVVLGTPTGFPELLDLATLDGDNGFVIPSVNAYEHLGGSVAGAGDVNGDGIEDVAFSSGFRADVRFSYVLFGNADGFPAEFDLAALDGSDGFRIAGDGLASAGDLNGDGLDDLIFAAQDGSDSYVVLGTADGFAADLDVTALDGSNGFRIVGKTGAGSGLDVNGDGIDDLIVGNSVLFGSSEGFAAEVDLSAADGARHGVSFDATPTTAGDVNGDGIDDLTFGSPSSYEEEISEAYVVYGSTLFGGANDAPTAADDILNVRSLAVVDLAGDNGGGSDRDADLDDLTIATINNTAVAAGDSIELASGIRVTFVGDADVRFESAVAPGISLADSFTYEISDGRGGSDTATVTVSYRQDALSLGSLDGTDGFRLTGVAPGGLSGFSVAGAGDVNADGLDDVVIGAPGVGESYVLFGSTHGFPSDVGALDGSDGFRIEGIGDYDGSGSTVASAGDVNDDGIDDVIISAPGAPGTSGECYVVFGSADGFAPNLDLGTLDGTNGFSLGGTDPSDPVRTATGAGDVNGDGIDDLIVGVDAYESYDAPAVYLVFGSRAGLGSRIDLSTLNPSRGVKIDGVSEFNFLVYEGTAVAGAGDVNGDGIDDAIVGDPRSGDFDYGSAYLVFGSRTGFASSFSELDGTNGFQLASLEGSHRLGSSVAAAGDVNGDGLDDLIIGSHPTYSAPAVGYVLFGSTEGFAASISDLDGSNGFQLVAEPYESPSVAGIGDINGDGLDDLLVGSYVVFGSRDGFDATVELSSLDGTEGYRLEGAQAYDGTGSSGASAGDLNGDGADDLIVGAPYTDVGGAEDVGASYVVFGSRTALTGETSALIASSSDDAEQARASGPLDLGSEDLDIGGHGLVGLRFTGLAVPDGASITGAYIEFEAKASDACKSSITIALEDTTSAATFGPAEASISAREYLDETTSWRPEAWVEGGIYRTADLAGAITALIGTEGLDDNDALVFRFAGKGEREAASFESSSEAPRLVITYGAGEELAMSGGHASDVPGEPDLASAAVFSAGTWDDVPFV